MLEVDDDLAGGLAGFDCVVGFVGVVESVGGGMHEWLQLSVVGERRDFAEDRAVVGAALAVRRGSSVKTPE